MLTGAGDRQLSWLEDGVQCSAPSLSGQSYPFTSIQLIDDTLRADQALRLARNGVGMLWRGDYRNARQLLSSLRRRLDRQASRAREAAGRDLASAYAQQRQEQAERSRILGSVIMELSPTYILAATRAPDVATACTLAYGPRDHSTLVTLPELLGIIGAAEWRRRGMIIPFLGAAIHPHYGVFGPTRLDYVDLFSTMPLPSVETAFDIGTGTGVLAAILAKRGIRRVSATDIEARAVACATDNIQRLGFDHQVSITQTDLFPEGRADLIVCNPPWLPGSPTSTLERGVYDSDSAMLTSFVAGLTDHLNANGEAWLVMSDLAERLGLRDAADLPTMINSAGLVIDGSHATHPRAVSGTDDLLSAARAAEIITVWRIRHGQLLRS